MPSSFYRAVLLAVVAVCGGCLGNRGFNPMQNISQTTLDGRDFQVVSTNLRGEATTSYLFGFIPLGDVAIATRAMDELVSSADLDNKPRALTNFAYDHSSGFYLILATETVKVRADVVEFDR